MGMISRGAGESPLVDVARAISLPHPARRLKGDSSCTPAVKRPEKLAWSISPGGRGPAIKRALAGATETANPRA
jgi:hypothetical protein